MIRKALSKSVALVPWSLRTRIKRIPLVAAFQRWLLARFVEGHEFVHTVDAGPARGLRYPIRLPDDKGVWTGAYELDFSTALGGAVRPGDVCCDIGGWRGFFSGVMALAGAKRVYTFEPLPANIQQVRRLIQLNPDLPLELVEAAVGEQAGELDFLIMPQTSMGKFVDSSFQPEERGAETLKVPVVAVDDLVESGRLPAPAVMKIDVEGAELLVLRGARRTLAKWKPTLLIEIHSRSLGEQTRALLAPLGYEIQSLEPGSPEVCHFLAIAR